MMSGLFEKCRVDSASVPDQYLQNQVASGPRASRLGTVQGSCDADLPTGSFGSQCTWGWCWQSMQLMDAYLESSTKAQAGQELHKWNIKLWFCLCDVCSFLLWWVSIRNSHMISTLNIKLLLSILLFTFPQFSCDLFLQVFSSESFSLSPHPWLSTPLPNPTFLFFHHSPYCCWKIYLLYCLSSPLEVGFRKMGTLLSCSCYIISSTKNILFAIHVYV